MWTQEDPLLWSFHAARRPLGSLTESATTLTESAVTQRNQRNLPAQAEKARISNYILQHHVAFINSICIHQSTMGYSWQWPHECFAGLDYTNLSLETEIKVPHGGCESSNVTLRPNKHAPLPGTYLRACAWSQRFAVLSVDNSLCFSEDTIEENIVKCNVSKMELDYKFGGQNQGCIGRANDVGLGAGLIWKKPYRSFSCRDFWGDVNGGGAILFIYTCIYV